MLFREYQYLPMFVGIAIIAVSLTIFYYYQGQQYDKIRATLIDEQRIRQIDSTHALAEHIGSSLDSIATRLEVVAKSTYAEEGDFSNKKLLELAEEQKESINAVASIDFMFINDKDGVRKIHLVPDGTQPYTGFDFAARDYMEEAKTTQMPVFSDGYVGSDAQYRIAIAYPIENRNNGEYQGVVAVSVPAVKFFDQFANTRDSGKQFAVVLDNKANVLAIPFTELVGKNFFADDVQTLLTENNEEEVQDFRNLFDMGQSSVSVDDFGQEHRITTREPVLIGDNAEYFIIVSTSSTLLYSDINPLLEGESLQGLSMLLVASAGVGTLIFFLARWNSSLNDQVVKRTKQLNESNRMLQDANEKLRKSDQLQKEFINIAAHELRTPIQPLLGIAEMLDSQFTKSTDTEGEEEGNEKHEIEVTRPEVEIIIRNARRLERLSSDILEVARIESQSLRLNSEKFDINKLARDAIDDIKIALSLSSTPKKIRFGLQSLEIVIEVNADRARLFEVISNLLRNAAKFTADEGSITVFIHKVRLNQPEGERGNEDPNDAIGVQLSVVDTGSGIDPEILPRMFSKFTTKSETGTGLGLYISKSIIEAHSGRIWAENNKNGIGAKVTFVIPTGIKSVEPQSSH